MNKAIIRHECVTKEKVILKSAANRTRSKVVINHPRKSCLIQSLSFESYEIPKSEKRVEMSSSRLYAKGIRCLFSFATYMLCSFCLSVIFLVTIEPFYLVVQFKLPTIKPLAISSKELFAKRVHDERSTETESSKTPMLLSPNFSSNTKIMKVDAPSTHTKSDSPAPLITYGYNVGAKPSEFAHLLGDLLLPQSIDAMSSKDHGIVMDESV